MEGIELCSSLAILNIATLIKLFRVQLSLRLKTVVGSQSVILKLPNSSC